ncbi:hypothetical protein [Paenibacillus wenxiniae]|uniref:Sulfotransferase family protein n=1 Tax=Paenibacillus wenxiniae TaxID=1636843 RepID=A0ABW4RF24_9BACL
MFGIRRRRTRAIQEIIIHAGMHKTGTTSIQETLFAHADQLKQRDLLYPTCWPSNHSIPIFSLFKRDPSYFENIVEERSRQEIEHTRQHFMRVLQQEIATSTPTRLVLSGENISLLTYRELRSFRLFLQNITGYRVPIRVIVCVRHPVPWLISATQQRLKSGQHLQTILDVKMRAIIPQLFQQRIGNLMRVFGKKALTVYSFDDAVQSVYGPVGYFLQQLGYAEEDILSFDIKKANESMSFMAARFIAFINEKCPIILCNRKNELRTRQDIDPLLAIRGPKFDIAYTYKKDFLQLAQADLAWLKAKFNISFTYELSEPTEDNISFPDSTTIKDIKAAYDRLPIVLQQLVIECWDDHFPEAPLVDVLHLAVTDYR